MAHAHIEALLQINCCTTDGGLKMINHEQSVSVDLEPSSGGRELARTTCDVCGSEYMFGVITRTREQSLASDKFDTVEDAVLAAAGVDTEDYSEPDDPDVAMCVRCDGPVRKGADFCSWCQEFVCSACRQRAPRVGRHQADEHWQAPKFAEVAILSPEDDGSVLTGEDAIFTPEVES